METMIQFMETKLIAYNKKIKSAPIQLVISHHVATHILHITQAFGRPQGHVILIGDAGSGRRSCAMVSTLLIDYDIYQVLLQSSNFNRSYGNLYFGGGTHR